MKKFIASLGLVVISWFILSAGAQTNSTALEKIDSYLIQMEKIGFSGSVLVKTNGENIFSKGYGFSDQSAGLKNSPQTISDIGSITKQFTAAAILKLEMHDQLSVKDPITKYFEKVPADKKSITIHDLLRHQSGLKSNIGRDYEKISTDAFITQVMNAELRFVPGTAFNYSNIGYSLLGIIIEKVTGKTYEQYLYENLWKPVQMESTGYSRPQFNNNLIAVGYKRNGEAWGKPTDKEWNEEAPYWHLKANGGILSTTEDLYKWHQALLSDRILSDSALKKFYNPDLRVEEDRNSYYAYGWDVSVTPRNTTLCWHNGSNGILFADFLRFIDENVVIIFLSNKSHPDFHNIGREIAKIIFRKSYFPEVPFPDNEKTRAFTEHIIKVLINDGMESAKKIFSERNAGEQLLNFEMRSRGFDLIEDGKPELAMRMFEMNAFVYPQSFRALQALAEGHMETGNKKLAIDFFKKSLAIEPENPFVIQMLKNLETQDE